VAGVAVAALAWTVPAAVIYVDDDNCPGPGSGTEGDPYCSIQTAIDSAVDADEIIVAPGTYYETIDLLGKAVWLRSAEGAESTVIDAQGAGSTVTCAGGEGADTTLEGFTVTGGTGTLVAMPSVPEEVRAGGGMLNLGGSRPTVRNCIFADNTADSFCHYDPNLVYPCGRGGGMYNGASNPTVIDCVFTGNTANHIGGGMCNERARPTVVNCTFSGNEADDGGGGMCNKGGLPTVADCVFTDNLAVQGGGMFTTTGSPTVSACTFSGNRAVGSGGGMYNANGSRPTVIACAFSGNSGANFGGGMLNDGSSPAVINCTFSGNEADGGGGMCNYAGSPTVVGCTFSWNRAELAGGGMRNLQASAPTVVNCIFWGDAPDEIDNAASSPVVTSCVVQGGYPGNLDADPAFVHAPADVDCCVERETPGCEDPDCEAAVCAADPYCCETAWDDLCTNKAADLCGGLCSLAAADYRLLPGSPCIDAGDNSAVPKGIDTDLDGNPRFVDDPGTVDTGSGEPPIVDMGAYEFQGAPCPWDLDGDGYVFVTDLWLLLASWGPCADCAADFNDDGIVNVADLLALIGHFGPCP
jgi:hypothetical protein